MAVIAQPAGPGGRLYPHNDWEGDDFTPGAGGEYVTCVDTASGRAVAWATNGRKDYDGKVYRAAVSPPDPNGITLTQAQQAVLKVAKLPLLIPQGWTWAVAKGWLLAGRGLLIIGPYSAIPRNYRYQAFADFQHAIWWSHISPTSGAREWDPLNPETHAYGRWMPPAIVQAFFEAGGHTVAYVPLQTL
jgi:hypothetical protein